MRHCIILDDYQQVALDCASWSRLDGRVSVQASREPLSGDALLQALRPAQILVAMRERTPIDATLIQALPELELIVTTGMRNAAIDVEAAHARGITVCGTASASAPPAELAWALILGLARRLVLEAVQLRRNGPWQSSVGLDLEGRRLGLVGLGRTGTRMAAIGRAFGMQVGAWSPNLTAERAAAAGAALLPDLPTLSSWADFVSLHLVLSERSRGLFGRQAIAAMRPSACLINTARAGLVDEAALIEALTARRIAAAGLDVFDTEPLPAEHPFRTLPNVLATPHLGYVTQDNYATYFTEALEDIEAWLDGAPIRLL